MASSESWLALRAEPPRTYCIGISPCLCIRTRAYAAVFAAVFLPVHCTHVVFFFNFFARHSRSFRSVFRRKNTVAVPAVSHYRHLYTFFYTCMYRLYNIPAPVARGYIITPEARRVKSFSALTDVCEVTRVSYRCRDRRTPAEFRRTWSIDHRKSRTLERVFQNATVFLSHKKI